MDLTVRVVDGSDAPFPNADVILNGGVVGTTDATGVVNIPNIVAGNYDVEAQFSPCGNQGPPPPPPSPPAADPSQLPRCPAAPSCSITSGQPIGTNACPSNFAQTDNSVYSNAVDESGNPVVYYVARCDKRLPPVCTSPLERATRPAVVPVGGTKVVTLTLCPGPYFNSGAVCSKDADCPFGNQCRTGYCIAPSGCQQHCMADDDCENTLVCTNQTCVPIQRLVHITSGSDASVSGGSSCYSDDVFPPSDPCTENHATFGFVYTNQPR